MVGLGCQGLTPQQQPGSYRGLVWFGLSELNPSATARVIPRFGLVCQGLTPQQQPGSYRGLIWFGLSGLNPSATARIILRQRNDINFELVAYSFRANESL